MSKEKKFVPVPSDRYATPQHVFDYCNQIFRFDLDVCAEPETAKCKHYFTAEMDALSRDWIVDGDPVTAWMNPPYSNPQPWIDKAKEQATKGTCTVALLPGDISTKWYRSLKGPNVTLAEWPGRIRFFLDGVEQGSPNFGSVIVIFWPKHPHRPKGGR
jgi:phage N-6-adenine-methyltransferase